MQSVQAIGRCLAVGMIMLLPVGVHAAGAKKVIRLDALKVEGRIQKPQAFYILQRSNLIFQELDHKQSFVPKIIQSIETAPF